MGNYIKYYAKTTWEGFLHLHKMRGITLFILLILGPVSLFLMPELDNNKFLSSLSDFIKKYPLLIPLFWITILLFFSLYTLVKKGVEQEDKLKPKLVMKIEDKAGAVIAHDEVVAKTYEVHVKNLGATILKNCMVKVTRYTLLPGKKITIDISNGDISGSFDLHPYAERTFEFIAIYNDGDILFNKNIPFIPKAWDKYKEIKVDVTGYAEAGEPVTITFSYKNNYVSQV